MTAKPTDSLVTPAAPRPNSLWHGPQRPIDPDAERKRYEVNTDPQLIELARNWKLDEATKRELAKYDRRCPWCGGSHR